MLTIEQLESRDCPAVVWQLSPAAEHKVAFRAGQIVVMSGNVEMITKDREVNILGTQEGDTISFNLTGEGPPKASIIFAGGMGRDVVTIHDGPGAESYNASTAVYRDAGDKFDLTLLSPDVVKLDGSQGGYNNLTGQAKYDLEADGFYVVKHYDARIARPKALADIKKMVLRISPELTNVTDKGELSIILRDLVHTSVRRGRNRPEWQSHDAYERFLQAVVTREKLVYCQGTAWLYIDVLNAFGIRAREVGLRTSTSYLHPSGLPYTHTSVEVVIDGMWVVSDPTWNVSIRSAGGSPIKYSQMYSRAWEPIFDASTKSWLEIPDTPRGIDGYAQYLYGIIYRPLWI